MATIIDKLKSMLASSPPDVVISQLSVELNMEYKDTLEYLSRHIGGYIKTRLLNAITREIERARPPLDRINVTDLSFPCLRHAYYSKVFHSERRGKFNELLAMWIGIKLHETKILEKSELALEYMGIYGRVDEYEDGVLLEIKTTRSLPSKPYPHHVRQVNYYRVLLERNGYAVRFGVILYINVYTLDTKTFIIFFDQPLEDVEREMLDKKKRLEEALRSKSPPPQIPEEPWACDYCIYAYMCGMDTNQ